MTTNTAAQGAGNRVRMAWYRFRSNTVAQKVLNVPPPKGPPVMKPRPPKISGFPEPRWERTANGQDDTPVEQKEPTTGSSRRRWSRERVDAAPWQGAEPIRWRSKWWYPLVRGLVLLVLLAVIITAVRTWFFDDRQANQQQATIPAQISYPSTVAAGAATRFAQAYLTWDSENPETRDAALATAGWGGDTKLGWDGQGRQSVEDVSVAAVEATSPAEGSITVVARVQAWTNEDGELVKQPGRWTALRVPVRVDATGTSITGQPSTVAVPTAKPPTGESIPDVDSNLTSQTREGIETFFRTYGEEADVSGLTAPGAQIGGLGGALGYEEVRSWRVAEPTGDRAPAVAVVAWRTPDGAGLEQTYRLTLQRTTAGTAERWEVSAIT